MNWFRKKNRSYLKSWCIVKNTLVFICSFIITFCLYFLIQTRSPISDVFTTNRISILKDRPANITRDIIVDMSTLSDPGGMMTLSQALLADIAKKRPNWRFLVLITKDRKHMYDFPKYSNIKLIETENIRSLIMYIEPILNSKTFGLFHDKLIQLLYYDLIFRLRPA